MTTPKSYGAPIRGTLESTTYTVWVDNLRTPSSLWLSSDAAVPAIKISMNYGQTYLTVTPTGAGTGYIYYILQFPVTTIEFVGDIGDTFVIL